jgi:hypothetical protein
MKGIANILKESRASYDSFGDVPWANIISDIGGKYMRYLPDALEFHYKGSFIKLEDNGGEVHVSVIVTADNDVPYSFSNLGTDHDEEIAKQLKKTLERLI